MVVDTTISVPVKPETTHRPRFGGRRVYTVKETREYQAELAERFGEVVPDDWYFDEPLRLDVVAVFPRPKYMYASKYEGRSQWYTPTPDFDNISKGIMDAFTRAHEAKVAESAERKHVESVLADKRQKNRIRKTQGKPPLKLYVTKKSKKEAIKEALEDMPEPWRDDSRVTWGRVLKVYASEDEDPHITVRIRTINQVPIERVRRSYKLDLRPNGGRASIRSNL